MLDIGGDVNGPDLVQVVDPLVLAPVKEAGYGPVIRLAGVGVPDGGGEEIDETPGGLLTGPQHRRWQGREGLGEDSGGVGRGDLLSHQGTSPGTESGTGWRIA